MMQSIWKKRVKIVGIFVIVAAIVVALCYLSPIAMFIRTSRWAYNVENFDEYQEDFYAVASFCSDYFAQRPDRIEQHTNWLWYYSEYLSDRGDPVEISDELKNALSRIGTAFPNKDAKLDVIRCYGNTVYFCTHNGQYSLVYSPDQKPTSTSGLEEEDVFVTKVSDGWYHVVRNNH